MPNVVVFTQRVEIIKSYNERRDSSDQRIPRFLEGCGYIPIALPNNIGLAEKIISFVHPHGIVLTGGNSLSKYGGDAPEKDELDRWLINFSISHGIPLFGFCRGMQSILDYFGNPLRDVDHHVAVRHDILGAMGASKNVNSYHNQGCVEIMSKDIDVIFKAKDGVVEMIRHKTHPIVGIMWHPEREKAFDIWDKELIIQLFGGRV